MSRTEKERAIKKVEIAIDKMIDLQNMGLGCTLVSDALEKLNAMHTKLYCERTA